MQRSVTRALSSLTLSLAAVATPASAQAPIFELGQITAPGAAAGERLGDQISLAPGWLCGGIPNRDLSFTRAGVALVWPRQSGSYGTPVSLESPTPTANGGFGLACALSGTGELVVSERRFQVPGASSLGAVHHYVEQAGTWISTGPVANPGASNDGFGQSVAYDGDLMVVGAPLAGPQPGLQGVAHVFQRTTGGWTLLSTLDAGAGGNLEQFGWSVAVQGRRVLVGAPRHLDAGALRGAAYFFEEVGGVWTRVLRVVPDATSGDRYCGVSVAMDGNTAVIGATQTNQVGAVYHYERAGGAWSEIERLQPGNLGANATFGHSVAVRGDQLVVGAYQDTAAGLLAGSAWTFERVGGSFVPRARLVQSSPPAFHGFSVALDGAGEYVVGQPIGTPAGGPSASGILRWYRPEPEIGASYCTAVNHSGGLAGQISALGSAVAASNSTTLVAHDLPSNAFGFFITSRTQGMVAQPGGSQGVLCLGGAIGRYVGPGQIANSGSLRTFQLDLDLSAMPTPNGLVPALAGETWNFQAWHRDLVGGSVTSNFTGAVSVLLQ
ncbi:hypothetical protein Poly30_10450 [Planctomycetes bacterium Poly30]|uniref:Cortical protein marker for cell polarity n=1 Tax=Saltatorellus ferox TaxID=2528018 RepID=A0A518EN82_9BACT|nr:hypothetical protein Poly30_10450 [Planctomycetes bacterium Poly30]